LLAVAQRGADVLLADRPCLITQTAVNLANEGKSIARAREGCIGDDKKESAVRNNDAFMHQQLLVDASPLIPAKAGTQGNMGWRYKSGSPLPPGRAELRGDLSLAQYDKEAA